MHKWHANTQIQFLFEILKDIKTNRKYPWKNLYWIFKSPHLWNKVCDVLQNINISGFSYSSLLPLISEYFQQFKKQSSTPWLVYILNHIGVETLNPNRPTPSTEEKTFNDKIKSNNRIKPSKKCSLHKFTCKIYNFLPKELHCLNECVLVSVKVHMQKRLKQIIFKSASNYD